MNKPNSLTANRHLSTIKHMNRTAKNQLPIVVEKDEDGFYAVECPLFQGCYSQGKTLDQALKNIREAVILCLKEKENQLIWQSYRPQELSLHSIVL